MVPVFSFSFTAPPLFWTTPVTARTYSFLIVAAFANPSLPTDVSSNRICIRPERSLRSTKIREPRFLLFCVQPISVTVLPIISSVTSAHLQVRFSPIIDSAISPTPYPEKFSSGPYRSRSTDGILPIDHLIDPVQITAYVFHIFNTLDASVVIYNLGRSGSTTR